MKSSRETEAIIHAKIQKHPEVVRKKNSVKLETQDSHS
jgi:hypothetical protein